MTTVPQEAVKAAQNEFNKFGYTAANEKALISALTAALPHLPGVGVKKLEWRKYRNGDAEAVTPFGEIYTAYVNGYWRITRNGKAGKFIKATGGDDVDAAKAGAQADYEARILSALEPSAAGDLALEEGYRQGIEAAAKLIECGCKALLHGKGECQFPGNCSLEDAAAIRSLGTSREQQNKAVSNLPDQQENEPVAHGERERALEGERHIKLLAEALGKCLVAAGIVRPDAALTGPELLMFAEDLERALSSPDHADAGKLVEGDGWLPIESAPKDGTIVLLGWNDPDIEEIGAVAGWYEGGPADKCWYDQYHEPVTATHWMPLRPLPSAPSQEGAI